MMFHDGSVFNLVISQGLPETEAGININSPDEVLN